MDIKNAHNAYLSGLVRPTSMILALQIYEIILMRNTFLQKSCIMKQFFNIFAA